MRPIVSQPGPQALPQRPHTTPQDIQTGEADEPGASGDTVSDTPLDGQDAEPPSALPLSQTLAQRTFQEGPARLLSAIRAGSRAEVRALIVQMPVLLNAFLDADGTALHHAAFGGQTAIVEVLIAQEKIEPSLSDAHGYTPLHHAVYLGHTAIVELLLGNSNTDVNAQLSSGETPFHLAIETRRTDLADLLLKRGANFRLPNEEGVSPLHNACDNGESGDVATVVWLLDVIDRASHSAELRSMLNPRNQQGLTPLHLAIGIGQLDVAQALLRHPDVDPNAIDPDGHTPLQRALLAGETELAMTLLHNARTHIDLSDAADSSPFCTAIRQGHLDVARALHARGADIHQPDEEGNTAWHIASSLASAETVEWLIGLAGPNLGGVLNRPNHDGRTPLHEAALAGQTKVVDALLKIKAVNPNTRARDGWTPLTTAIRLGHVETARVLLNDPRTDLTARGPDRQNILHIANVADDTEPLLEMILLAAKKKQQDKKQLAIVQALICQRDQWGAYPVSLAAQRGKSASVIDALRPAGITKPQHLVPTSYRRGWLITGGGLAGWKEHRFAEFGSQAGIEMHTYGDGVKHLSWKGLQQLDIHAGDFVVAYFHAAWDEERKRVMVSLGKGELVPLVEVARLLAEKGVIKALLLGCEVSIAALPMLNGFQHDPTMPRPADPKLGYQGFEFTMMGREKIGMQLLAEESIQLYLEDCITKGTAPTAGTALYTQAVQPHATIQWDAQTEGLTLARRAELQADRLDPGLSAAQRQMVKESLLLLHVKDNDLAEVEALLTRHGVSASAELCKETSALLVSSQYGLLEMTQLLLKHGADMRYADKGGAFALYEACEAGHEAVVATLIDHGADVGQTTAPHLNALTALHIASWKGRTGIVRLLLDAGAKTDVKDSLGQTPLDFAQHKQRHDIAVLLLEHERAGPV